MITFGPSKAKLFSLHVDLKRDPWTIINATTLSVATCYIINLRFKLSHLTYPCFYLTFLDIFFNLNTYPYYPLIKSLNLFVPQSIMLHYLLNVPIYRVLPLGIRYTTPIPRPRALPFLTPKISYNVVFRSFS